MQINLKIFDILFSYFKPMSSLRMNILQIIWWNLHAKFKYLSFWSRLEKTQTTAKSFSWQAKFTLFFLDGGNGLKYNFVILHKTKWAVENIFTFSKILIDKCSNYWQEKNNHQWTRYFNHFIQLHMVHRSTKGIQSESNIWIRIFNVDCSQCYLQAKGHTESGMLLKVWKFKVRMN